MNKKELKKEAEQEICSDDVIRILRDMLPDDESPKEGQVPIRIVIELVHPQGDSAYHGYRVTAEWGKYCE